MHLCENMWRWPYSGAVGTMLLLLLGSSSAQDVFAQLSCQEAEVTQNITQPKYNSILNTKVDAVSLVPFVQSFLYTVQPHPFPERKCCILVPPSNSLLRRHIDVLLLAYGLATIK